MPKPSQRTMFIDADACPVTREALDCARRAGFAVVIAGNTTQNLEKHVGRNDPRSAANARRGFWVDILDVSVGSDSADFAIVERLKPGDVVVTQDIGLASMALGRGAFAIGVRGHIYRRETIDAELLVRHEEKKLRRSGGRTGGPAPFTSEDRRRFSANLKKLLSSEPFEAAAKQQQHQEDVIAGPVPTRDPNTPLPNVAFVDEHNSCGSQIAEALAHRFAADAFNSYSAGTKPAEQLNPDAERLVEMLYGIRMKEAQHPKHQAELPKIDMLVTMGNNVEVPTLPCSAYENWDLNDPVELDDGAFIEAIAAIERHVVDLKRRLLKY